MKKNKKEDDEEIRRAKANIRTGFIIAVIVIALLAVIAFVMVGLMSAIHPFRTWAPRRYRISTY